jgi:hypothetical protein
MASRVTFLPESAVMPGTNFPAPGIDAQLRTYLAFDATTDEACDWTFIAPQGLTGTITVVITYRMASATTGACRWEALLEAITDGDTVDTDAASSFDTTNSNGATVPGTAGYIDQISITMTNADSIAAGDICRLRVNRDANGTTGTDDATGDAQILAIELRDAA